jgi:hypothetical protein
VRLLDPEAGQLLHPPQPGHDAARIHEAQQLDECRTVGVHPSPSSVRGDAGLFWFHRCSPARNVPQHGGNPNPSALRVS